MKIPNKELLGALLFKSGDYGFLKQFEHVDLKKNSRSKAKL